MLIACSHGTTGTPTSASSSVTPASNADDPGHVTSSCTLKSSWNSGSTSRSRVAAVTLWTTRSTRSTRPRVAQRAASSPTGTRIHPAPATPPPASRRPLV
ncbi:hypothetical protein OG885_07755 [Streptomyces sp. NBC_00028]|uniref:hypothetical protein n=1 Tax=Streptomyces sp. NBC_00028 TaxID=2975624 RepID=UPI00324CC6D7